MKSLLQAVRAHPLWSTVSTLGAALLLIAVFAFVAPVRIQVTVSGDGQAAAAPVAEIPTATPAPPPPTATPVPPTPTEPPPLTQLTPTPEPPPPSATPARPTEEPPPDEPPPDDDPDPTATPVPPTATRTPPTATPVVVPPDVQIVKTSTLQVAKRGDEFEYVIVGRNAGGSVANDVVITDSMPAPMEILGITSSKGDYNVTGQSITVYPRTLAPGEEVRIVIRVRVRADAPAGIVRNLALIFTSTPGDPPPNRTDTPVEIVVPPAPPAPPAPPIVIQQVPPRMPDTADPAEELALLLQYLPLFALALVLALAGGAAHFGAFRSRFVRVQIGYAGSRQPAAQATQEATPAARSASFMVREVEIAADPDALYARWRAGESVTQISAELAGQHPAVSKTQIAVVVQQLITDRQKA